MALSVGLMEAAIFRLKWPHIAESRARPMCPTLTAGFHLEEGSGIQAKLGETHRKMLGAGL